MGERLLAECVECGNFQPAERLDGRIRVLGSTECADCGGESFREVDLESILGGRSGYDERPA